MAMQLTTTVLVQSALVFATYTGGFGIPLLVNWLIRRRDQRIANGLPGGNAERAAKRRVMMLKLAKVSRKMAYVFAVLVVVLWVQQA